VRIAADITTGTKVKFPEMAGLYWDNPQTVNPACFARASMSIPFFFHPYRVMGIPQQTASWTKIGKREGLTLPQNVMFMDGGIMSNFPINVFHEPYQVPTAPTFGAKIGIDQSHRDVTRPAQLLGAVFDAAHHTLDEDFIEHNPDYRLLVKEINTGNHHWLNFSMEDGEKVDLFARGAEAAAEFLCGFEWEQYKKVRHGIGGVQAKQMTSEKG
jgi:NTE family protein